MIRTILFDLDGTFADTAPDLAHALNLLLQEQGKAEMPFEQIRPVVSHGGKALIELGFGISDDNDEFEPLRQRFLDIYCQNLTHKTVLFPGIAKLLAEIDARKLNWGIVTNKPGYLTDPLMQQLQLAHRAASIVSGDTLEHRKPHPAPMLLACEQAGSEAHECMYIGDAERDILAGNNAGMLTVVALYGYIGEHDKPHHWGADHSINDPMEVLAWL